jgi:hypothetical protein
MPNARHHLINACLAFVAAVIWVLLAGAFSWGAYSSSVSTRFFAYALASPYSLAGLVLPENIAVIAGLALQFGICFAGISLLNRKRIRETP